MSIIAVDFDGTLCQNRWPEIGAANHEVIRALIRRQIDGDKVILWTCRCGPMLDAAVDWCRSRGLIFDAINANLPENIEKYGNDCRKVYAHEYWDDKAVMVRGGQSPLMAWFQENGNICLRRWYKGTLALRSETLWDRIKRRWRTCR